MSTKTARVIRRYCATHGKNYRDAKRKWQKVPWNKRHEAKEVMMEAYNAAR